MKYRTRIQYTAADKALMWERWRQGESLHAIARLFDRYHSVVGGILSRTGGIPPPPRRRSHLALALAEREETSRGVLCLNVPASSVASAARRRTGLRIRYYGDKFSVYADCPYLPSVESEIGNRGLH